MTAGGLDGYAPLGSYGGAREAVSRTRRRAAAAALVVCAFAVTAGSHGTSVIASEPPSTDRVVRIMPLGDSITDGWGVPGGYRILLEDLLAASGARFDFVGTLGNGPPELADRDHEGHSGWRIDELDVGANSWVAQLRPDVVLVLAGTNDVWQQFHLDLAPQRLLALLETLNRVAPGVRIVVASLPPLPDRAAERDAFNASLPAVVATARAQGIAVVLTPSGSALTNEDLEDRVHPNQAGHGKLASAFHAAVIGSTP